MSELISQFIQLVGTSFAAGQASHLVSIIPLGTDHPYWQPLQQALSYTKPSDISIEFVSALLSPIPTSTKDTLASFIQAILNNARPLQPPVTSFGFNAAAGQGQGHGAAEAAYTSFARLLAVYSEANRLYAMSANGPYLHPFLNPLILDLARRLVPLSTQAADLATSPSRDPTSSRSIKDTTRQTIERSFQVASAPVQSAEWDTEAGKEHFVGDILWSLANILWRIYAEAVELRRNIQSLTPAEDKRLAIRGYGVRQADVCESWYWRGRLGVILLDIRGAKYSLDRAMRMCPESGWQQQRAILIRLIPINLLLGTLPLPGVLQHYNLNEFEPLVRAYKDGNVTAWRRELGKNREWYRSRSIWLILFERGEILVWRNLFRQALRSYYLTNPDAPKNRCPTWIFISATSRALAGSSEVEIGKISLEDIICITSSLIDQGLILGNLSYSNQTLVMKPANDGMGGFPKVSMVVPRTVNAIA